MKINHEVPGPKYVADKPKELAKSYDIELVDLFNPIQLLELINFSDLNNLDTIIR